MAYKIDVRKIFKDHSATIVNRFTAKPDGSDYISFLIVPLLFAGLMVGFDVLIAKDMISNIISVLAIFVGLLLNVVVLLFDIIRKEEANPAKSLLVREVLSNIMFTILLSVVCIIITLITLVNFGPSYPILNSIIAKTTNFICYFLFGVFLMTLLMIIKRMYALFENEINQSQTNTKPPGN